MAGQIPDPRTLNSWEDAFQYPLPIVRKLEQQLRKNIDDNRQKLRSLVGASYRDLLGTAERIIEMDRQMETVETYVGDIGRKCNARTVENIAENHAQMRKTTVFRDGDRYRAMAQTKVLQSALTTVARIIKTGGDASQASKLLVLSRLLYKSISEGSYTLAVLEELQRKLMGLRKKLLSYIERAMVKPSAYKTLQAHTLCAQALITNSTPKEVLRRFLQVRYEQLVGKTDSVTESDLLQMLDLFGQTLLDTRDLFPRRLAESLMQLTKAPLLRDDQIQSVFELNIDIYGTWIAEDVRTFTPWLGHDSLTASEVADALESWAGKAQECLMSGLQNYLKDQDDARSIVETRRKVLSTYMSLSSRLRSDGHGRAVHDLRDAFLQKLEELATKATQIDTLMLDDSNISNMVEQRAGQQSMWDLAAEDLDLSLGALKFRSSIVRRRHSRNTPIDTESRKLDEWMGRINDILYLSDEMRVARWDNNIDFDLEDVDGGDLLLQALSKEDPERLQRRLRESTQATLTGIIAKVTSTATKTKHAAFLIRMWREVDQRRRTVETCFQVPREKVSLVKLHRNLALSVSRTAIERYVQLARTETRTATILWDGSPPLPIQPSPAAFGFLEMLHRAMSDAGNDLWSPQAVVEVKSCIVDIFEGQLADAESTDLRSDVTLTNGHVEADDEAKKEFQSMTNDTDVVRAPRKEWLLQNLFDMHYVRRIVSRPDHDMLEAFDGIITALKMQLDLDDASNERLKKGAKEHWKRTYLLFGLLAAGDG